MQNCSICNSLCSNGILLSNGAIIHKECYDAILEKKQSVYNKLNDYDNKIISAEKQLNSLTRKMLRVIGRKSGKDELLKKDLKSFRNWVSFCKSDIKNIDKQLSPLYDYWLKRPPDWEERRQILLEEINFCEECGSMDYSLHIHHKIPVSKGGSNKKDNLKVLCEDCHQLKHKHNFTYSGDTKRTTEFEIKYSKLRKAIDENRTVTFKYRKYKETRKTKRTIKPEGFETPSRNLCVYGYCYLRNDNRHFVIRRISKLKIN